MASLQVFPIGVACIWCNKMIGELFYDNSGAHRLTEYRILCNKCYDGRSKDRKCLTPTARVKGEKKK